MNGPRMPALGVIINGSGIAGPPTVDLEDFEPQPRDRCNTWPLQKPAGDLSHHTSPLIHEEIPEEEDIDDDGSGENLSDSLQSAIGGGAAFYVGDESSNDFRGPTSGQTTNNSSSSSAQSKKNSARRNAWGNLSYADLITQAILNSPEKRLTLSQIYDWMVQNVPYFRDKGDSNSSAGWKNSIRHNLSLHSRFMRIQNEGAGKSSWWVINPEAKPGKSSRRRAGSMEQSKSLEKKRGRVKKKLDQMRSSTGSGIGRSGSATDLLSPTGADSISDLFESPTGGGGSFGLSPGEFRLRSDSNLSNYSVGSNRLSPKLEENYDDWAPAPAENNGGMVDVSSYPELADSLSHSMNISGGVPADTASGQYGTLTGRDTIHPPPSYSSNCNTGIINNFLTRQTSPSDLAAAEAYHQHQQRASSTAMISPRRQTPVKSSPQLQSYNVSPVKSEPPAYQELYPGCRSSMMMTSSNSNPMLRDVLQKPNNYHSPANANHHNHHHHHNQHHPAVDNMVLGHHQLNHGYYYQNASGAIVAGSGGANNGQLPQELSDIRYDNHFTSDIQCDIDQVIRHELNIAGKIDFSDFGNI